MRGRALQQPRSGRYRVDDYGAADVIVWAVCVGRERLDNHGPAGIFDRFDWFAGFVRPVGGTLAAAVGVRAVHALQRRAPLPGP